jgi:tRNA 2-selenouridine synthase SelU
MTEEFMNYNELNEIIVYLSNTCPWSAKCKEEFEKEDLLNFIKIVDISFTDEVNHEAMSNICGLPTIFNKTTKSNLVGYHKKETTMIIQRLKIEILMIYCTNHVKRILKN